MTWSSALGHWSFDPPILIAVVLSVLLYQRGQRSLVVVADGRPRPRRRWNTVAFYAGLAFVWLALQSPIDYLAASLFWPHMLQHLLLIMVAAPLLLLSDPLVPMLRGIPLSWRREVLGLAARQSWVHRAGHWFRWLLSPRQVFVIFLADLYLWHWTWLFDLTLRNDAVHLLEHVCFTVTALMFWSQVIDQRTVRAHLSYAQRAGYTVLTAMAGNILAMYFVFTPKPLYAPYATLTPRPFGISALADQQFAGALMWVPVLFLFGGAFAICLFKALGEDEEQLAVLPPVGTPYSVLPVRVDGQIGSQVNGR